MIRLTNILLETLLEKKLCPKGRAYYNRRIAAGEKPSAYLSGRAVKVCKGLMEDDIPQSGESSGTPAKFKLGTKPNKIESLTLDQILQQVKGIPYYKEVLDDLKNKDESWGVTKKVKEYAEYLMKNPSSSSKLPSVIVVDGKIQDGAHRISAIYLLQNLLDPKNNFWKNLKLKVEFWNSKNLNENIDPSEAYSNIDSIQTIVDGKRNVAFVVEKGDTPKNWERVAKMVSDNGLKSVYVKGNPHHAYVVYTPEAEKIAMELKTIAEKYDGYLSSNATAEDTRRIGQLLDYDPEQIELFIKDRYIDEGLEDTSWTGSNGKKITLQQLLDATKDYPVIQAPIEKVEKIIIKKDTVGIESDRLSAADVKYPIIIVIDDNGNYKYILDGNHRANKAIDAGLKSIPAKLVNIKKLPQEFQDVLSESLRDWFEKEDWVRIDTQGNITGPCGTMKKGNATTRCLPRAKANSLTKAERAATARKKVAGSKKGKQFVANTEKAKVRFRK